MPLMEEAPHVLAIPYPAQGHVKPLMEFSHYLVQHGLKVTFVNTEFNHRRVLAAASDADDDSQLCLESIPDGLEPEDDRTQLGKLSDVMWNVVPGHLENLIKKISEYSKIKCVIADTAMGFVFEVAEKMGLPRVGFWPASGALFASLLNIPKLIQSKIIDANGSPCSSCNQMINLSPEIPAMKTSHLVWLCMGDSATQKSIFNLISRNNESLKHVNFFICNSFYELEPFVSELVPNIQPIGPLLANSSTGNFWPKDSSCLAWLDQQPARSVIYVAFGSFTIFNTRQFEELALGLELSGRPFLWVVRPDFTSSTDAVDYPNGFIERVGSNGRMVSWAPQKDVLAHPSIACFLSHCGWNSILEGLSNGVPFLCCPYFADQFLNESYVCDVWKVGLRLKKDDESGIILREEIKGKVDEVVGDEGIKASSLKLKEMAARSVSPGGTSLKNMEDFIRTIN